MKCRYMFIYIVNNQNDKEMNAIDEKMSEDLFFYFNKGFICCARPRVGR